VIVKKDAMLNLNITNGQLKAMEHLWVKNKLSMLYKMDQLLVVSV
jgi:hypothetical protein